MIQQVAFEMPVEIARGIHAGKYIQCGGIIRDGAGRIVKHLKPADISNGTNKAMQFAAKAVELAKANKKVAICALAVAGAAAVGGIVYAGVSHVRRRQEEEEHKTTMAAFNTAFSDYLLALSDGELTIERIDALEAAIAALGGGKDGFTVEIEGDQFKSLVRAVRDYTDRLSKANGNKRGGAILELFEKKADDVDSLKECLETQREILSQAA